MPSSVYFSFTSRHRGRPTLARALNHQGPYTVVHGVQVREIRRPLCAVGRGTVLLIKNGAGVVAEPLEAATRFIHGIRVVLRASIYPSAPSRNPSGNHTEGAAFSGTCNCTKHHSTDRMFATSQKFSEGPPTSPAALSSSENEIQ